ncbi:hypothetical protein LTR17_000716 [Elasticomyces elasticus]|nr:hypothetical protein LTR17_000716 [Elasticomyces elasticus]
MSDDDYADRCSPHKPTPQQRSKLRPQQSAAKRKAAEISASEDGSYDSPESVEGPKPLKRAKVKPQQRPGQGSKVSKSPNKPPPKVDDILQLRLACSDKRHELDAITQKDAGALAMIEAINRLSTEQQWGKLVIYRSRHSSDHQHAHDEHRAWENYKYGRWEVISKLLDFVFLHIEMIIGLQKVEYRSLWAHSQVEENIPARITAFVDFLASKGARLAQGHDIYLRAWAASGDVVKWIEIFQVDTATYQEHEELLDYRIW